MSRCLPSGIVGAAVACCLAVTVNQARCQAPQRTPESIPVLECNVLFPERRTLASERSGILAEVVKEGDTIDAGDVVIRLKDDVPRSAFAVADARASSDVDVRLARKEREAADVEYQAALEANRKLPAFSDVEVRRLQVAAEAAALRIEQADHELEIHRRLRDQARDELHTYSITSPISGMVTRAFKGSGEAVQVGEPVLEVVNTQVARVEGFVALADAPRVKPGMPVIVRVNLPVDAGASPDRARSPTIKPFEGRLGFVDVSVQPVTRVVRVWAEVDNRDALLRDGLTATMTIDLAAPPRLPPTTARDR